MTSRDVTNFLHSRNSAALAVVLSVIAAVAAFVMGKVDHITGDAGILYPSPNQWIASPLVSIVINQAIVIGLSVATVLLTKGFNMMRAQTALWATMFVFILVALPSVASQFYGGTLLCVTIVAITAVMFTCYGERYGMQRVFLMFFLLSMVSLVQYAAIFYSLVLFIGLAQMRVLSLKSIIAAILGIITPAWVIFGCGIASVNDVDWPEFVGTLSVLTKGEMVVTLFTLGLTILLAIGALVVNLMKILSYTAKFRSFNGFLSVVLIATILLMFVDYNNLAVYIPLLDFMAAYQLAHAFSNYRTPRSYISILSILVVYICIYAINLWL